MSVAVIAGMVAPSAAPAAAETAAACSSPIGSAADDAIFDVPYRTDFGTPQHEDCSRYDGVHPIDFGELADPPIATPAAHRGVDVVAHWYNDFGTWETLRRGDKGWYDWSWNFPEPTNADYDPARHPLLGFYRGDDPKVLGWISYWLANAGVNAISLQNQNGFTTEGWDSTDTWGEMLLERTPNAKALSWVLAIGDVGTPERIEARSRNLTDFAATHRDQIATTRIGTEDYALVNVTDLERMRGAFDSYQGSANSEAFLASVGERFRSLGFGGVAVMARNAGVMGTLSGSAIPNVRILPSTYEGIDTKATSYPDYVASVESRYDQDVKSPSQVLGVATAGVSTRLHDSNWNVPGSTPSLFHDLTERTVRYIEQHDLPRLMTVYNVSEWAEAGPGLIPEHRDGYGYLEALRTADFGAREFTVDGLESNATIYGAADTGPAHPNAKVRFTGTGTPGARVFVYRANNKPAGSAVIAANGTWWLDADLQWGTSLLRVGIRAGSDPERLLRFETVTVARESSDDLSVESPRPNSSVKAPVGGTPAFPNARLAVFGRGTTGAEVVVYRVHNGKASGRAVVGGDGAWNLDADVNWGTWDLRVVATRPDGSTETVELPKVSVTRPE